MDCSHLDQQDQLWRRLSRSRGPTPGYELRAAGICPCRMTGREKMDVGHINDYKDVWFSAQAVRALTSTQGNQGDPLRHTIWLTGNALETALQQQVYTSAHAVAKAHRPSKPPTTVCKPDLPSTKSAPAKMQTRDQEGPTSSPRTACCCLGAAGVMHDQLQVAGRREEKAVHVPKYMSNTATAHQRERPPAVDAR